MSTLPTNSDSRGLEVPETAQQRRWIDAFALSLAG